MQMVNYASESIQGFRFAIPALARGEFVEEVRLTKYGAWDIYFHLIGDNTIR